MVCDRRTALPSRAGLERRYSEVAHARDNRAAHAEGMATMAEILVVVEDLIFLSKIRETARLVGVAV